MKQSTLGSCIRSLRKQNHLTQLQLADQLGVTDKAVSKWERDLSCPDIMLFPKLADVLGVTVNDLLRDLREECRPSRLRQVFEMSRDIRTPLHIMLGFVEIAKNNHDDPEMLLRYLEGIKVSGEYLMTLLNGIMKTSSCEEGTETNDSYEGNPEALEEYLRERIASWQGNRTAPDFSGKRILVVDDLQINREIAAEILMQTGAKVELAGDGRMCLEMVEAVPAGHYDLILMDIMMPVMDGLEATRWIRQLPDKKKKDIPIIAMATNVLEKDREEALKAGMNAFAEKPILVDTLFETMKQYLIETQRKRS